MIETAELAPGLVGAHVPFTATPTVHAFIHDTKMITALFGPFGCGKTTAGVQKAYLYAQAFPGAKVAVIRDVWPSLRDTTQVSFFDWFKPSVVGHYHKTEKRLSLRTGTPGVTSEILFRALDDEDDVKNLLSLELAAAWIDEPQGGPNSKGGADPGVDVTLFRSLLARVGRQKGYPLKMVWMTGNPPSPRHWIAQEFEYSGRGTPRTDDRRRQLYLADVDENRANLPPNYYEDLMELWGTGTPLARRFIFGEWTEFASAQPFHDEWILTWTEEVGQDTSRPALDELVVEAGIDPAISKSDTAAKSAIVVAGQCLRGQNRGRIYVLHTEAGHWTAFEQADRLVRLYRDYGVRTVRVEDVAYQRALGEVLDYQARLAGVQMHVSLVAPDADKLRRANSWSSLVEQGRVLLGPGMLELRRAMTAVPMDKTLWDLVDAAGLCIRGFSTLLPEQARLPSAQASAVKIARSYATRREGGPRRRVAPVLWHVDPRPTVQRAAGYAGPRRKAR